VSSLGDILVLGLGASGVASARYCAELLGDEVISVTAVDGDDSPVLRDVAASLEELGVRCELGVSRVDGRWDLCIASPGIAPHTELMRSAVAAAEEVVSEIEFAYRRSSNAWVAITGTNGKTTTTALVTHLLNSGGIPARAIGNIGTPAITAVRESDGGEVLVAEVSSFQLASCTTFHPRVAVLLNITPDHLDWHGSLERYIADKARIFDNLDADDTVVIDVDDDGSRPWADVLEGRGVAVARVSTREAHAGGAALVDDATLVLDSRAGRIRLLDADQLRIKGRHNVSNALAAAAAAHAVGVSPHDLQEGLASFAPIAHRLEPVGEARGAEWFNDSKATNPDAVFKALAAFDEQPMVLLVGGRNKGNDFGPLASAAADRARVTIAFGECGPDIAEAFGAVGAERPEVVASLPEAVALAARVVEPGEVVVLSPACASFDEFDSYAHRGRVFAELVGELGEEEAR